MLKKFGLSLIVMGLPIFGATVINTAFVGAVMAEEKTCSKCGHMPAECAKTGCKCDCQKSTH